MNKKRPSRSKNGDKRSHGLSALVGRRRELAREIERVDAQISRLEPRRQRLTTAEFDRLLDQASEGLDDVPPLPADFSRADLYEDHD